MCVRVSTAPPHPRGDVKRKPRKQRQACRALLTKIYLNTELAAEQLQLQNCNSRNSNCACAGSEPPHGNGAAPARPAPRRQHGGAQRGPRGPGLRALPGHRQRLLPLPFHRPARLGWGATQEAMPSLHGFQELAPRAEEAGGPGQRGEARREPPLAIPSPCRAPSIFHPALSDGRLLFLSGCEGAGAGFPSGGMGRGSPSPPWG